MYIDTVKSDEEPTPVDRKSDRDSFFDELDALLGLKPKSLVEEEEVKQVDRSELGKFIMFIGMLDYYIPWDLMALGAYFDKVEYQSSFDSCV